MQRDAIPAWSTHSQAAEKIRAEAKSKVEQAWAETGFAHQGGARIYACIGWGVRASALAAEVILHVHLGAVSPCRSSSRSRKSVSADNDERTSVIASCIASR